MLYFIKDFIILFIILCIILICYKIVINKYENYENIDNWNFKLIESPKLIDISISSNGKYIWAINIDNSILFRNNKWKKTNGNLKQLSVTDSGSIWGINNSNNIFYRPNFKGSWKKINGGLSFIVVSGDGNHIWGSIGDSVYYRKGLTDNWKHIKGGSLKYITVSYDGKLVYGIGKDYKLYKIDNPTDNSNDKFHKINSSNKNWKTIDISSNGKILIAITNNNKVFYTEIKEEEMEQDPENIIGDCKYKLNDWIDSYKDSSIKKCFQQDIFDKCPSGYYKIDSYGSKISKDKLICCSRTDFKAPNVENCIVGWGDPKSAVNRMCSPNEDLPTGENRYFGINNWSIPKCKTNIDYKLETKNGNIILLDNSNEDNRSYSSIFQNDNIGTGYAQSKLFSNRAWCAAANKDGQWMKIDLQKNKNILGIVTQGRAKPSYDQYVKEFSIEYSLDNKEWNKLDSRFETDAKLTTNLFNKNIYARYIKIIIHKWNNHISLRCAIIVKHNNIQLNWKPFSKQTIKKITINNDASIIYAIDTNNKLFYITNIIETETEIESENQPDTDYIRLKMDCPGNNLETHLNTNLQQCKQKCNSTDNCLGISFLNNTCITKTKSCDIPLYNYKHKWITKNNYNNVPGITNILQNSKDNKIQYLGKFNSDKECEKSLNNRNDITSYTWFNNNSGKYKNQCYGRTDGIWNTDKVNQNKNSISAKLKKSSQNQFTKIKKGNPGSNSPCGDKCIYDDEFCIKKYGQCGILETEINDKCGNWDKCEGVVCNKNYNGYCLARGKIGKESNENMWGYKKNKDDEFAFYKKNQDMEHCNWKCYLQQNPDLTSTFGKDNIQAAKDHYYTYGKKEGRICTCPIDNKCTNNSQTECLSESNQCNWDNNSQSCYNNECQDRNELHCEKTNNCEWDFSKKKCKPKCLDEQNNNICEEEDQLNFINNDDEGWIKNYCVKPPYQLLGHTDTKEDCEALCQANHTKACSYQCNGCYGGPDIQPSLKNNLNCFQYAKNIITEENIITDENITQYTTKPYYNTNIPKPYQINNTNIEDDIISNECTNFIGYQKNGISMNNF